MVKIYNHIVIVCFYSPFIISIGVFNDLWKYSVSNNTWTWIAGNTTLNQHGVYGEKSNASVDNFPGARYGAVGWFDSLRQEFWLFGGNGYDAYATRGMHAVV